MPAAPASTMRSIRSLVQLRPVDPPIDVDMGGLGGVQDIFD